MDAVKRRSRLGIKLLAGFLIAALVPLIGISAYNTWYTGNLLRTSAERTLLGAASQTASRLDAFVIGGLDSVRTEAQLPSLVRSLTSPGPPSGGIAMETNAILQSLRRKDEQHIISYALINANGVVIADTQAANIGSNERDLGYIEAINSGGVAYSSPLLFSPQAPAGELVFAAPVRAPTGEVIGFLRARYNASIIQDILQASTTDVGNGADAFVLTEEGLRLADSRTPELINTVVGIEDLDIDALKAAGRLPADLEPRDSPSLPAFEQRLGQISDNGTFIATTAPQTGVDQVAVASMVSQRWKVAFVLPIDTFQAPISQQLRNSLLIMVAVALGVSAVAIILARLLTAPLNGLTAAARAVAAGDLTARAKASSRDELGELAGAFNLMADRISDTMASLEERVATRTKALQSAMEQQQAQATMLQEALETQQQLNLHIAELSMPLIQAQKGVLVVPLVGSPDQEALQTGLQRMLAAVKQQRTRAVVLDVTGVAILDDAACVMLQRMQRAVSLLGADLVIVGVSPEVAQSLVAQQLDTTIRSFATLGAALEALQRR